MPRLGAKSHLDTETPVVRSTKCLSADVGGETVLMNGMEGCYAGLDDIGRDIWRCLEQPTTVAAIRDHLAARYDGEPSTIEADVLAFLTELLRRGMIEVGRR